MYIIPSKQIYIKQILPSYTAYIYTGKQIKPIFLLSHKHTIKSIQLFVHTQKSEQHPREPFAEKSSVSTNETEPSRAAASVSESSVAPLRPRNRPTPCATKGSLYDFDTAVAGSDLRQHANHRHDGRQGLREEDLLRHR